MKKFLKLFLVSTVIFSTLFVGNLAYGGISGLTSKLFINQKLVSLGSPRSIKGGVVRVIDSATGDIPRTTSGWIEDEKYGWRFNATTNAVSGEFDSSVKRTGNFTLKLSTTDTSGTTVARLIPVNAASTLPLTSKYAFPIKASTNYIFKCYAKTNNAASNAVFTILQTFASDGVTSTSNTSSKYSGTNDWFLITLTFTTNASAVWGEVVLNNNVAGNISDAWFDVNSMTLEEVSTITAPSASLLYPKVTAVTSNDNIDQSQVISSGALTFGDNGTRQSLAHNFVPTKKNDTGVIIRRRASTGTFTGNVTISLQATTLSLPNGSVLATVTIPNSTWEAITVATDYTVPFNYTLTPGTTYSTVLESSTHDNSNHPNVEGNAANSGLLKYNGSTWSADGTSALYFKTLYSKNTTNFTVRTDTQTMSVTAPTTNGWPDGTVIDTATLGIAPLNLTAGVNNIYYSSNGPATADGTVDPSLQAIITPNIFSGFPSVFYINTGVGSAKLKINQ